MVNIFTILNANLRIEDLKHIFFAIAIIAVAGYFLINCFFAYVFFSKFARKIAIK
jgi:hypothetical protein